METDITQTTYTDMKSKVDDFSVAAQETDAAQAQKENFWDNDRWSKDLGYFNSIPEYKTAIKAYATWVIGKGYETDNATQAILDNIRGWGEDTFLSLLWNMIVVKKFAGDAFAEIIRNPETGTLLNLKPKDPGSIRIVTDKKGSIIRYEQRTKTGSEKVAVRKIPPEKMLHFCNDRVADEIHGRGITESIEWVILARNEAMADYRRILHRSTIRVLYVDEDDKTRQTNLKKDYAEAINRGELLILPAKRGDAEFQDLTPPPGDTFVSWIKYLENFFYQALGVPKVILGGSEEFTEASSKIGYLTFEQIYSREVAELIADLWNQLAIRITINKPASLQSEMLSSDEKNQAQTGFQPNDMIAGRGK